MERKGQRGSRVHTDTLETQFLNGPLRAVFDAWL